MSSCAISTRTLRYEYQSKYHPLPCLMRLKTGPEQEAKQQSITSRLPPQSCKRPNARHLRRQRMADMRAAGPPGPVFPPFPNCKQTLKGSRPMNKILVAVFDTETAAYEGLSALKELNASGDITLNATAVIAKSADGALGLRQAAEQGPGSTALGLITGSLIGLLAGPLGLALGATAGGLTGLLLDLRRAGMSEEFVQEVSEKLAPGKSAVLADMDETWTVPVDTRLEPLGAVVVRHLRAEVEEDQLNREAAQLKAERAQLKAELAEASDEAKTKVQAHLHALEKKAQALQARAQAALEDIRKEAEQKTAAMQAQIQTASERQKAKVEQRLSAAKASYEARTAKLKQAWESFKQALS